MTGGFSKEPMLDIFLFETTQMVEQLEQLILDVEKSNSLESSINEIFRIMHTIKGSSAMMLFNNISSLAHTVEDVFFFLRENKPQNLDFSKIIDIVLESIDFIKNEITKIELGNTPDGDESQLNESIKAYLLQLKGKSPEAIEPLENDSNSKHQKYYVSSYKSSGAGENPNIFEAVIHFDNDCEMENIRAFTVIHNLKDIACDIQYTPSDIIENEKSIEAIKRDGFYILFKTHETKEKVKEVLEETLFLKELHLSEVEHDVMFEPVIKREINLDDPPAAAVEVSNEKENKVNLSNPANNSNSNSKQNYISVSISKMDQLMDLIGELVISEAMVTQNPDLNGLVLDNFTKAARQLRKITSELQDAVMSIRMVPLYSTFQKMNRIVRDMGKKLNKEVELEIIGEETEVDKNIIEHIQDPLMHLIRNSIDHGLETTEERIQKGKPEVGKVTLEAKNAGGDVLIVVKDDGKGLDKDKILNRARQNGLIHKPESELTDKEIYSFILLPGFSTKEKVTEFSGRGVGMDVVLKNIENIGGTVIIDSSYGCGTSMTIKIPLTLAIVDGMIVKVGNATYTIPTVSIKESFRAREEDIIRDTDNHEMIMIRGQCHPVMRLYDLYKVTDAQTSISQGIIVMVENNDHSLCIFADALLGEQQVVVKALPKYIKKVKGIAGCTLLGDGSISLILDISALAA